MVHELLEVKWTRGARAFRLACYSLLMHSCAGLSSWAQGQSPSPQNPPQVDQIPPQGPDRASDKPIEPERWNLFYQATSIGQYHGTFHSPYSGPFSLQDYPERDVSLTTTLFLGIRLEKNTVLYFDPEIAGGKGFSGVDGLANSSNGELPRECCTTSITPTQATTPRRSGRRNLPVARLMSPQLAATVPLSMDSD